MKKLEKLGNHAWSDATYLHIVRDYCNSKFNCQNMRCKYLELRMLELQANFKNHAVGVILTWGG